MGEPQSLTTPTDTTIATSTQPPMPDAQLKLESKEFLVKNLAAVVIQTDPHSKLWMVTELAADPELTTPNFLTVAPTDKLKPTVKFRKKNQKLSFMFMFYVINFLYCLEKVIFCSVS